MRTRLYIATLPILVILSCSSSWDQRQKLHKEYLISVDENGYEASREPKKKLEHYDSKYREFAHDMILSKNFVNHQAQEYSDICQQGCGPLVDVVEGYLKYLNSGNLEHIDQIIQTSIFRDAFFRADGIIKPDQIPVEKRLAFFPDHGLVRSVMHLLNESANKGNREAHSLLKQIETFADGENKTIAREYLGNQ